MGTGRATMAGQSVVNAAFGVRRVHLTALSTVLVDKECGLYAHLVGGGEGLPLLRVWWVDVPGRLTGQQGPRVDVGCNRVGGKWWLVVDATGEGIVPVDEMGEASGVLLGILKRKGAR